MTTQENMWRNLRLGNFSASQVHRLMVSGKKKDVILGDGAMTYIMEKVAEMLTGERKPQMTSKAIEWGNTYEAEAMSEYIARTGHNVLYFGKENPVFFPINGYNAGGSPDGLIEGKRVVEIKCPYDTVNHIENCIMTLDEFKKERKEYYAQCQLNMVATNVMVSDFCSYDQRVIHYNSILSILEVPYDKEFCNNMLCRIESATKVRDHIYNSVIKRKAE